MTDDDSFDLDVSSDDGSITTDTNYSGSRTSTFLNESSGDGKDTYTDPERTSGTKDADAADQVNIRKLVREPSLSDIRWIYRNTFAKVLVDKPVDDAYKNGFSVNNDPSESITDLLDTYVPKHRMVKKKARRDGMAVLYKVFSEVGDQSPSDEPTRASVTDLEGLNVLTVDDLADVSESEIEDDVPSDYGKRKNGSYNYECRASGLVLSKKVNDVSWNDPIGVVLGQQSTDDNGNVESNYQFIHGDRLQYFTHNGEVDGDFNRDNNSIYTSLRRQEQSTIGKWEGDSMLQPCYHLMKDLFKGNWATMQTVFRYASPFYEVTVPARDCQSEEEFERVTKMFNNLNSKSEGFFPEGYEVEMHDSKGEFNPEEYFNPIFDQICAATEMTRSVLFGTQAGTVSGSGVDRSNYTNQVTRLQENEFEDDYEDFIRSISLLSNSIVPNFALGYEISWNPIFELDQLDKAENARTIINAITQAANQYALEPSEIRSLVNEIIQDLDYETDLSEELDVEDFDMMVDLELAGNGQYLPMNFSEAQKEYESLKPKQKQEVLEQGNPRVGQNVEGSGNRSPAEGSGDTG